MAKKKSGKKKSSPGIRKPVTEEDYKRVKAQTAVIREKTELMMQQACGASIESLKFLRGKIRLHEKRLKRLLRLIPDHVEQFESEMAKIQQELVEDFERQLKLHRVLARKPTK